MFRKLKEKIESEDKTVQDHSKTLQNQTSSSSSHVDINELQNDTNDENNDNDDILINEIEESLASEAHNELIVGLLRNQIDNLKVQLNKICEEHSCCESQKRVLFDENSQLKMQLNQTNKKLEDANNEIINLKSQMSDYQSINRERDDLLLRNAQLSNEIEKLKQELSQEINEKNDLQNKLSNYVKKEQEEISAKELVSNLKETIAKLEETIIDKNKAIKLQQQRINDIKKTYQRDILQNQLVQTKEDQINDSDQLQKMSVLNSNNNENLNQNHSNSNDNLSSRDINFTYLRNVLFKFMTSSEYEAIHLVKAISVLLNFTNNEEKMIRETLEWKMSWFAPLVASKPKSSLNKK